MYVKKFQKQHILTITTQYTSNQGKKRTRDNKKSKSMTDNNKRLRKYILATEYFKTFSMVRRK